MAVPLGEIVGLCHKRSNLSAEVCRQHLNVHNRFLHFLQGIERKGFGQKIEDILEVLRLFPQYTQGGGNNPGVVKGKRAAFFDGKLGNAEAGFGFFQYAAQGNIAVG